MAVMKEKKPEPLQRLLTAGALRDAPGSNRLFVLAGKMDVTNRYPSTVLVTAELGEEQGSVCSGAVISPRLVLTAGHCVCPGQRVPSKAGGFQTLIDGDACVKAAQVTTSLYDPRSALGNDTSSNRNSLTGVVVPHPKLRVVLDARDEVLSSNADLALILLDEPLGKEFKPLPLAEEDVRPGEFLVIVGSGYDELNRFYDGERRASRNKVAEVSPFSGGRVNIEQPGGHHYRGDSGGPCLREAREGMSLVGISSRNLGEGSAMTSTFKYRDWLRGEIQRAAALPPPEPLQKP